MHYVPTSNAVLENTRTHTQMHCFQRRSTLHTHLCTVAPKSIWTLKSQGKYMDVISLDTNPSVLPWRRFWPEVRSYSMLHTINLQLTFPSIISFMFSPQRGMWVSEVKIHLSPGVSDLHSPGCQSVFSNH